MSRPLSGGGIKTAQHDEIWYYLCWLVCLEFRVDLDCLPFGVDSCDFCCFRGISYSSPLLSWLSSSSDNSLTNIQCWSYQCAYSVKTFFILLLSLKLNVGLGFSHGWFYRISIGAILQMWLYLYMYLKRLS
jgi:hypothetical protein